MSSDIKKASDEIQKIMDKYDLDIKVLTMREEDAEMMVNIMSVGIQVLEGAQGKVDKEKQLFCLQEYILPLMDRV